MRPNFTEMSRTGPLPYSLMAAKAIDLQIVSVSDIQNLNTVS